MSPMPGSLAGIHVTRKPRFFGLAFSAGAEFPEAAHSIDRRTPIYIDADLGDGADGAREPVNIHELGFGSIYLATRHPVSSFSGFGHLRGVVGKEPPWLHAPVR